MQRYYLDELMSKLRLAIEYASALDDRSEAINRLVVEALSDAESIAIRDEPDDY